MQCIELVIRAFSILFSLEGSLVLPCSPLAAHCTSLIYLSSNF